MKKLEKLKLHNLEEICADEQKSIKGGDGWSFMEGPDGNFYSCPGGVTIYGSAPGWVGNLETLRSLAYDFGNSSVLATLEGVLASAAGAYLTGEPAVFLAGTSIGTGIQSVSDSYRQTQLNNAIFQVQNSPHFQPGTQLRYSFQGNKVLIWNLETGQLLGESD